MAFERFTERLKEGRVGEPMVSIWKTGKILFNMAAMRKFELFDFDYAVLFFDKDSRKVGIMFTNKEGEDGSYNLIKPKAGGYAISATKFLKHHKIDYSEAKNYIVEHDEETNLYIFKVD